MKNIASSLHKIYPNLLSISSRRLPELLLATPGACDGIVQDCSPRLYGQQRRTRHEKPETLREERLRQSSEAGMIVKCARETAERLTNVASTRDPLTRHYIKQNLEKVQRERTH